MWDLHAGVGRDIDRYWSWFADFGGIVGTVRNNDNYWLLAPLHSRIYFERKLWFAAAGLDFYPWGKPGANPGEKMYGLRAARPYLQLAAGHVHAKEIADVRFRLRHTDIAFKQYRELSHDVDYISPRIGIETPLGRNDSLKL